MKSDLEITKIEIVEFKHPVKNLGKDYNSFNLVYTPNNDLEMTGLILRIHTSEDIIGEYEGLSGPALAEVKIIADYLLGKNPLEREQIYNDTKRGLRHGAMLGTSIVDICLWDIAGKLYEEPIWRLLGGQSRKLPCYASTLHGDENGGLTTPDDFIEFAEQCFSMGYPAFKIHGWGLARNDISREISNVLKMGDKFKGRMDLMIDPACEIKNFMDALALGKACDEAGFFWWEDPYQDGGVSQFSHRKLRQMVKTPLLQTEHIRMLEQHVDFIVADGTDLVRAGAHEDGGITGVMKIAHAAEGFGLDVELHGPGPAHRHLMTSIRNTNYFEMGLVHPDVHSYKSPCYLDYSDNLDSIDKNGNVEAPDKPGLGVTLDWDWINKFETDRGIIAEK